MDLPAFRYIQSEFLVGAISTRRFPCVCAVDAAEHRWYSVQGWLWPIPVFDVVCIGAVLINYLLDSLG